ncbi:MAG: hypothetical protein JO139_13850, partial [Alphaproteobacteria bacterium]|nr:hypothetical protein [Alphaproteobacteria bacterium]
GEGVVITRRGRPVVKLKPIVAPAQPITSQAIDWLDATDQRHHALDLAAQALQRPLLGAGAATVDAAGEALGEALGRSDDAPASLASDLLIPELTFWRKIEDVDGRSRPKGLCRKAKTTRACRV